MQGSGQRHGASGARSRLHLRTVSPSPYVRLSKFLHSSRIGMRTMVPGATNGAAPRGGTRAVPRTRPPPIRRSARDQDAAVAAAATAATTTKSRSSVHHGCASRPPWCPTWSVISGCGVTDRSLSGSIIMDMPRVYPHGMQVETSDRLRAPRHPELVDCLLHLQVPDQ